MDGWSTGVGIVQIIPRKHPERVQRLILFDAVDIYEKPARDRRLFTPTTPAELGQRDSLLKRYPAEGPDSITSDTLRISKGNAWVIQRA